MNRKEEISGFILAGGRSSRMGTDKAMLLFDGEPLLARSINLIRPFCSDLAISGQNPEYRRFNLPVVPDAFKGIGPIAGIHSCLTHSVTDWNLIVGVDLPFLNSDLITFLLASRDDFDCVIPQSPSGIEPLAGLYHKRILTEIEKQVQRGDFKLMNLFEQLNVTFPDCSGLLRKYPRLFTNLNRPEDYKAI